jgi:ParB-like nuclease family protein
LAANADSQPRIEALPAEVVPLTKLRPHPQNYRGHPPDQLAHIEASLREHGLYRNVVVARDYTVLAGHGVMMAAQQAGAEEITVTVRDVDPFEPSAMRLLAGDNEISRLVEVDDRQLTEILKGLQLEDDAAGLLGTGFDEAQLANLLYVTRPQNEIESMDEAQHWAGMPEFEGTRTHVLVLQLLFEDPDEREALAKRLKLLAVRKSGDDRSRIWSARWPPAEREDPSSVVFDADD